MAKTAKHRRTASTAAAGERKSLMLFGFALLLGFLAQWLVQQPDIVPTWGHQLPGWLLFLAGGALLSRATRMSSAALKPATQPISMPVEACLLALIFAGALFLRLHDLKAYPTGGFRDEGENGNVAIRLLNGQPVEGTGQLCPVYIQENTENAAAFFYPIAVSFKLFGISITSERYVSVFFGSLAVPAFWALSRCLFGPGLALFLAACLATMRWHINFSRIGFLGIMTVFLSLPMLLWLVRGLQAPPPAKRRRGRDDLFLAFALVLALLRGLLQFAMAEGPAEILTGLLMGVPLLVCAVRARHDPRSRWFMLSALALAFAMYSYIAARLFVILVALIVGHHLLTRQRLSRRATVSFGASLGVLTLGLAVLVFSSAASASNAAWHDSALRWIGLAIVALGAAGLLRFGWRERALFQGWARPLALALGVGLVVAGPLYSYTLRYQTQVQARSYRVSIFNDQESDKRPWGARLLANLGPTLGMVNVQGDSNARHNLPGEPMVNPVWAALFGLGVCWSVFNLRDRRAWLALSLWQVSLVAGYFSMEAPQAYRCMDAIPAVLIFVGLAVERAWAPLKALLRKDARGVATAALLAVLAAGAAYSLRTYFVTQRENPGVWAEFSTAEYEMGQDLKALNSNGLHTHGLVRPDWADSYTFRFMNYPEHNYEYFEVSKDLPLRRPESVEGGDFLYILGEESLPLLGVLRDFYPHGIYREVRHPDTGQLLYWTYWVSAADAAKAGDLRGGLQGDYYQDHPPDADRPEDAVHWAPRNRVLQRLDPFIFFNWPVTPVSGFFSAQWTGRLDAPRSGDYSFLIESNSYADLRVDGRNVAERTFLPELQSQARGTIHLDAGFHRLRLRYYNARNYAFMRLWWQPPHADAMVVIPSGALSPR